MARVVMGRAVDRTCQTALVCVALAITPRVWTIATGSAAAVYGAFPPWMQSVVVLTFAAQLAATTWGRSRVRAVAATGCAMAALASAALFFRADPTAGNGPFWAVMGAVELWIVWRIGFSKGARHE